MRVTKSLLNLGLGMAGGCITFLLIDTFRPESASSPSLEVVSPSAIRPVSITNDNTVNSGVTGMIDLRDAAKKTVPAVVHVKTIQMGKEIIGNPLLEFFYGRAPEVREVPQRVGFGSGVIVSGDGYIVTNNHVIDRSDDITVVLNNKKEYKAKVIGKDANTDIALLKIEEEDLPYLEYGNSDDVELGEWVLAVGNPYNLTSTVTAGIISAKARDLGMDPRRMNLSSFLQTDAAVNPGNSGGALVNAKGELIGINTAIESPTGSYSGYAFAVPANIARKVVGDLKDFGAVQRAVMGIRMDEVSAELAKELGLREVGGIYVVDVITGGAASKAGLRKGDIIRQINGIDVNTASAFHGQLGKYHPGTTINLLVERNGKSKNVAILLQNMYGDTALVDAKDNGILGAVVEPLSKNERYRYGINKGVKIKELENGRLKNTGLQKGYIIVKINNNWIYDKDDLVKALKIAENEGILITAISPGGRVQYFALSLQD